MLCYAIMRYVLKDTASSWTRVWIVCRLKALTRAAINIVLLERPCSHKCEHYVDTLKYCNTVTDKGIVK